MVRKITGFDTAMRKLEEVPKQCKADLLNALGITSRQQLYLLQTGRCKMTPPKREAVRKVFADYGIEDPFDYEEVEQ